MVLQQIGIMAILLATAVGVSAQEPSEQRLPIIDVHVHALSANALGPPPVPTCAEELDYLPRDLQEPYSFEHFADCESMLQSPTTDEALMERTLELMDRYNIFGVTSGPIDMVRRWKETAPDRIIPGIHSFGEESLDSLRTWASDGTIQVLGELGLQYGGLKPTDAVPESYFALAEELDLPVAIHVGLGPPGAAYVGFPNYRMHLSNPLLLEEALLKHPKLRLYVMHAGWPMLDQIIGLLYAHPQVYVDIGVIDWFVPRKEFHAYLKRLVEAGFGKRIMFGSDQMIWPDALPIAIESIESAEFLSAEQKRDIFYNNAARFLRLDEEEIDQHHGR